MRSVARLGAAAGLILAVLTTSMQPAQADTTSIGWLRVSPATGTLDTPVDVLSQAQCPAGESVVVGITGPKIPTTGGLGYIVGNTAIEALPETDTAQLYVPLSLTIGAWFGRNVPGVTPRGTYTITLVCRDKMRSSKTYGSYTAKLAIAGTGAYKALGEAAKPLGIQIGSSDPFAGGVVTEEPSAGGEATPTTAPLPGAESSPPAEGESPGGPAETSGPGAEPGATQAAAASAAVDSGPGSMPLFLALVGALLVLGAFLVNRRRTAAERVGAREASRTGANR